MNYEMYEILFEFENYPKNKYSSTHLFDFLFYFFKIIQN